MRRQTLASLALAVGLGAAGGGCAAADPEPATIRTVSVAELAGSLDTPEVVVLDVRTHEDFEAGHIAGATWLDPDGLRATIEGVDGQVVPRATALDLLGQAGIAADDPLVIAGADNGTEPARVAWTAMLYGHEGPVALLDGGMAAWVDAGRAVTTDALPRGTVGYLGAPTREELRVDQAWMLAHLDDPAVAIFDVRTAEEYAEGHVPGAISVNWTHNLTRDGAFRPADEVRALHEDPAQDTLVVYCRTGSRAAVSWVLLRAAGYDDVRLYDGSWTEWGADPDTPKVTGPTRR